MTIDMFGGKGGSLQAKEHTPTVKHGGALLQEGLVHFTK
jgi:hypothetical protein